MSDSVLQGVSYSDVFSIFNGNHELTNPDTAPTVEGVIVDGVTVTTVTPVVAALKDGQATPADIVGMFKVTCPTTTLQANQKVQIRIKAVVQGAVVRTIKSFTVENDAQSRPYIQ